MNKPDYVKYCRDGIAYYIREDVVPNIMRIERIESIGNMQLMQYSDFVVNTLTNELVKCRYVMEDLIDMAFEVRKITRDSEMVTNSVQNLRNELLKRAETDTTVREIVFKLNSCLYKEYPHKRS